MELMLKATGLSMPVSAQNVATFTQKWYMNIVSRACEEICDF